MKTALLSFLLIIPFCLKSQELLIQITNPQVSGNQVTYDVTVDGFDEIVAYQFEIVYDPEILAYDTIQNITVPDLTIEDGFFAENAGSIVNAWIDPALEGVTLDSGTVIYQIVFTMLNDTFGTVCFNQDSTVFEFSQFDDLIPVYITDDCHEEPFLFSGNPSSTEDIAFANGLDIYTISRDEQIVFHLQEEKELAFGLFHISGIQVSSFAKQHYNAGRNALALKGNIPPGIYLLSTEINNKPVAKRVIIF